MKSTLSTGGRSGQGGQRWTGKITMPSAAGHYSSMDSEVKVYAGDVKVDEIGLADVA